MWSQIISLVKILLYSFNLLFSSYTFKDSTDSLMTTQHLYKDKSLLGYDAYQLVINCLHFGRACYLNLYYDPITLSFVIREQNYLPYLKSLFFILTFSPSSHQCDIGHVKFSYNLYITFNKQSFTLHIT